MADDLGYADVSCYGRPDLNTPNIDRLAARGIRFTQAYANSEVCSATRTALMTGRHLGQLPNYGPPKSGYDHFYGFRGGSLDYYRHDNAQDDCWDDDVPLHQIGYLTDLRQPFELLSPSMVAPLLQRAGRISVCRAPRRHESCHRSDGDDDCGG